MLLLEIVLETLGQKPPDQQHSKPSSCSHVPSPDLEAGKSTVLAHKTLSEHTGSQTSFG